MNEGSPENNEILAKPQEAQYLNPMHVCVGNITSKTDTNFAVLVKDALQWPKILNAMPLSIS